MYVRGQPLAKGAGRSRGSARDAGFTLLEVLMALLIGMVGLIGTVAVQQALMNATSNANDAQIAMRLATKTLEEFNSRRTQTNPFIDMLAPLASGLWTAPVYMDAQAKTGAQSPKFRWAVQTRVTDTGVARPYNLSVLVTYARDSGKPRIVQIDVERRKNW
jgi:prepilin-type N-terminal cleavage/methylation domain-containing protein